MKNGEILITILIVVFLTAAATTFFLDKLSIANLDNSGKTACTMEAKLCPDGSYVERTGPDCQFAECPPVKPTPEPPAGSSGIRGTVLLGPTCPVEQIPPNPKCADKPYATTLIVTFVGNTQIIKQFVSDSAGNFKMDLDPGEYNIISRQPGIVFPQCGSNGAIKVDEGKYTNTTIYCDTGIR